MDDSDPESPPSIASGGRWGSTYRDKRFTYWIRGTIRIIWSSNGELVKIDVGNADGDP